jgi:transposase-like protein
MIKEQGQSIQNVIESMDIDQTAIRRWLTQFSAEQNGQPQELSYTRRERINTQAQQQIKKGHAVAWPS